MSHRLLAGVSTLALGACLVVFGAVMVSWVGAVTGLLVLAAAFLIMVLGIAVLAPPNLEHVRED